jgi:hypothetical protein
MIQLPGLNLRSFCQLRYLYRAGGANCRSFPAPNSADPSTDHGQSQSVPKIHIHWARYLPKHLQFAHNFKDLNVFQHKRWLVDAVALLERYYAEQAQTPTTTGPPDTTPPATTPPILVVQHLCVPPHLIVTDNTNNQPALPIILDPVPNPSRRPQRGAALSRVSFPRQRETNQ